MFLWLIKPWFPLWSKHRKNFKYNNWLISNWNVFLFLILFPPSILIFMALRNSRTGSLPVSEIYSFMTEHFPYFKVRSQALFLNFCDAALFNDHVTEGSPTCIFLRVFGGNWHTFVLIFMEKRIFLSENDTVGTTTWHTFPLLLGTRSWQSPSHDQW